MTHRRHRPSWCPEALWRVLVKIPAFRYMKGVVDTVEELYEKYPSGGEKGEFAFVREENRIYFYYAEGPYAGQWRPMGCGCEGETPVNPDPEPATFEVSPTVVRIGHNPTDVEITVTAPDSTWIVDYAPKWLLPMSIHSTGVRFTVGRNDEEERTGVVRFVWVAPDGEQSEIVDVPVTQASSSARYDVRVAAEFYQMTYTDLKREIYVTGEFYETTEPAREINVSTGFYEMIEQAKSIGVSADFYETEEN